jgi:oxygen-dependent protoporphyrinogen oxidase
MALEPLVPARREFAEGEDESIGDFVARRLGREATDRLAAPLLGGIYAGDASALSIRATFPQFVEMEQKHGSLVRAMRAARRPVSGGGKGPPSAFVSLEGGLTELVQAVAKSLDGVEVRTGVALREVARAPEGDARGRWAVVLASGDTLFADDVLLATPAYVSADATRGLDADLAKLLESIPYASTATVFLAYRAGDVGRTLDATGFIVPRVLGRPVLAVTWVSSKWAHRAPDGHVLVRTFFGGAWGESTLANDDDALVALARRELADTMAVEAPPLFSRVFRFERASPQPLVGHLDTMRAIRKRLGALPGLYVAGNGYDGIGIPDCIRQAEDAARAILDE